MSAFWGIALCSLAEVDPMLEAVHTSETSVYINESMRLTDLHDTKFEILWNNSSLAVLWRYNTRFLAFC
jgi:hypothetical protein